MPLTTVNGLTTATAVDCSVTVTVSVNSWVTAAVDRMATAAADSRRNSWADGSVPVTVNRRGTSDDREGCN